MRGDPEYPIETNEEWYTAEGKLLEEYSYPAIFTEPHEGYAQFELKRGAKIKCIINNINYNRYFYAVSPGGILVYAEGQDEWTTDGRYEFYYKWVKYE